MTPGKEIPGLLEKFTFQTVNSREPCANGAGLPFMRLVADYPVTSRFLNR